MGSKAEGLVTDDGLPITELAPDPPPCPVFRIRYSVYLLSVICYLLFAICYLLFAICCALRPLSVICHAFRPQRNPRATTVAAEE